MNKLLNLYFLIAMVSINAQVTYIQGGGTLDDWAHLKKYETYVDLFIPSIYDAGRIYTQETALKYIATFTKGKTIPHVLEILMN